MERDGSAEPTRGADQRPERPERPERFGLFSLRREKIAAEIARNRRGEYAVPTWVLALILVLFVAAWATWVMLS
jgi:hypothetical protein